MSQGLQSLQAQSQLQNNYSSWQYVQAKGLGGVGAPSSAYYPFPPVGAGLFMSMEDYAVVTALQRLKFYKQQLNDILFRKNEKEEMLQKMQQIRYKGAQIQTDPFQWDPYYQPQTQTITTTGTTTDPNTGYTWYSKIFNSSK